VDLGLPLQRAGIGHRRQLTLLHQIGPAPRLCPPVFLGSNELVHRLGDIGSGTFGLSPNVPTSPHLVARLHRGRVGLARASTRYPPRPLGGVISCVTAANSTLNAAAGTRWHPHHQRSASPLRQPISSPAHTVPSGTQRVHRERPAFQNPLSTGRVDFWRRSSFAGLTSVGPFANMSRPRRVDICAGVPRTFPPSSKLLIFQCLKGRSCQRGSAPH
jgi:hypothetical protein